MKTITFLLLAVMTVSIISCEKDDYENKASDFSVLEMESVTVNDVTYYVNENLFWENVDDTLSYIRSSTEMNAAAKHCTIEYVVESPTDKKEVSAKSLCSDVSIEVSSDTTTSGIVYKVIDVTRSKYDEILTYNIFFADIED